MPLSENLNLQKSVTTNINGEFEIEACIGDSIEVSYVGFNKQTLVVSGSESLVFTLNDKGVALSGELPVMAVTISAPIDRENMLDLYVIDEDKKPIPYEDVTIERVYIDEDGEESEDYIDCYEVEDKNLLRIYWNEIPELQDENGKPLKEATLRITAEGYETPQIIKVKYPRCNTRNTIRFKHKK